MLRSRKRAGDRINDEIVAVRTDGKQTTVWRFAHHFSTYVGFWSSPRGNISQDGRFFMFTSNWGNTIGTDHEDAFICEVTHSVAVAGRPNSSGIVLTKRTTSSDPANRAQTLEGNIALTLAHPSDGEKALPVLCYSKSSILARAAVRCHFTRR